MAAKLGKKGIYQDISDEEIKKHLHERVGDFRPGWRELYLDLFSFGTEGALAQISKTEAVKGMTTGVKAFIKQSLAAGAKYGLAPHQKETVRRTIRSIRRAPQEVLDPLSKAEIKTMGGPAGQLDLEKGIIRFDPTTKTSPYEVVGHELAHVEDLLMPGRRLRPGVSEVELGAIEARAYEAGPRIGSLLKSGKVDYKAFKDELEQAGEFASAVFGRSPLKSDVVDFYRAKAGEIAKRTKLDEDPVGLANLVRKLGGEVLEMEGRLPKTLKGFKKGDIIDMPGVGKVRYDAPEAYGKKGWHQLTVDDPISPAHKATFISTDPSMETAIEKALKTVEKFSKGGS